MLEAKYEAESPGPVRLKRHMLGLKTGSPRNQHPSTVAVAEAVQEKDIVGGCLQGA